MYSKSSEQDVAINPHSRFEVHDERARFLDTLAILLGCRENLGGTLPDGKRPDVIRVNSAQGVLFIGDAKNTESPNSRATQSRLLTYLFWLSAHLDKEGRSGVFALCYGRKSDTGLWIKTILQLGRIAGISFFNYRVEEFTPHLLVVCFSCSTMLNGN